MKKVLITGKGSYIGEKVKEYLLQSPEEYVVDMKDTMAWYPCSDDFTGYDVVFNVAGIAHIKETRKNKDLYFKVNRDLCVNIAKAAKAAGVKQFILMSSMSVYGKDIGIIKKQTIPSPKNAYGKSKLQADEVIKRMENDSFKFCCLRPPMVYGKGCKGNYQRLRKFALLSPLFPDYMNERSMVFIGNLCEFVKRSIDLELSGLFFPQNEKYVNTSKMVGAIAKVHGKKLTLTKGFNLFIKISHFQIIKKVFGNLKYEPADRVNKFSFDESIELTEK